MDKLSKDEAIDLLSVVHLGKSPKYKLACDMAIKSIENQFTHEELEILGQCLSKHIYTIGGVPDVVLKCGEKIVNLLQEDSNGSN